MGNKKYMLMFNQSNLLENLVAGFNYENNANGIFGINNGTLTGGGYTTGKSGQAVNFTAQNQFISVPDSDVFSFIGVPFSISTWIYTDAYSSAGNRFLVKSDTTALIREYLCLTSSTNIAIFLYTDNSNFRTKSVTHGFSLNTWYHIVYTYDGTSIKIYKDGVDLGGTTTDTGTFTGMVNTTANLRIGSMKNIINTNHLGRLDATYFWKNRLLTAADVTELYNAGAGEFYPF